MHWLAALMIVAELLIQLAPQPAAQAAGSFEPRALPASAAALSGPVITDQGYSYTFGERINFLATVQPGTGVREMFVYLTPEGQQTAWQKMTPGARAAGSGAAAETSGDALKASASVDVNQLTLSPFSNIEYYYEATFDDGTKVKSDSRRFSYDDNRFTWQSVESSAFQANWNGSDPSLGEMILNIADEGLRQAQDIISASPGGPIRIYAYSSSKDLQSALRLPNYIAGHTIPEMRTILISVPAGPERKLELERQIPHEIMHILQYQVIGDQSTRQPVWLIEGMASLAELVQNPDYRVILETYAQQSKLLPISSLCVTFPGDQAGAKQAYAQSDSFVRFLYQKYGTSGLRRLIDAYKNGLGCEEGVPSALGVPLRQVEYRWQQEALGMNAGALALSNLSPYLLLGLVILVIPGITSLLALGAHKHTS